MYAIHKRFTLDPKTRDRLKVKGWKKLFHAHKLKRDQEWLY